MLKKKLPRWNDSGHENHLCYLVNMRYLESDLAKFKGLVKEPRYICSHCGRVAADKERLCNPSKL
ncbi:MAG: hypothetical protein JW810_02355 [Sedimentisphaerales bacterium]|nr:hypothetical protein [Sedimentisphaerales bacterium]